jgi:hypothetical protein
LVYRNNEIKEKGFQNLPEEIPEGTTMVFNNTKVIQARLIFHKETGARIEIFCLEPLNPADYSLAFQAKGVCTWKCIIGNLRKWKTGVLKMSFMYEGKEEFLCAEHIENLKSVEKDAYLKLKKNKIIRDEEEEPAIRVALRNIKDFATPLKFQDKIIWKYAFTPNEEIESILNPTKDSEPEIEETIKPKVEDEGYGLYTAINYITSFFW